MKNILILLAILVLLTPACTEDKGSYVYTDLNEVIISGVEDSYVALSKAPLVIRPEITQKISDNESDLEFLWYSYNDANSLYEADTLAYTKDLELESLLLDPQDYKLVFRVTDTSSGIYYDHRSSLVVKGFPDGLQVLSNKGGDAQVSILRGTDAGISDFEAYKAKNNGEIAGTNPVSIIGINAFMRTGKPYRIAILCNDDNLGVYTTGFDLTKTMAIGEAFSYYSPPENVSRNLATNIYGEYVVGIFGDGNLYTCFQPGGPFGAECKMMYTMETVSPNFSYYDSGVMLYNPTTKGFGKTDSWGSRITLLPPTTNEGDAFDVSNTGLDVLYGKKVTDYGMGVFVDGATNQKYILAISGYDPAFKKEMSGENLENASVFELLSSRQILFYTYGNVIYTYDIVANKVLYTYALPEGMTVDRLKVSNDDKKLYVGMGDGTNNANSGSVHILNIDLDGEILGVHEAYDNKFGKVVDFYENY